MIVTRTPFRLTLGGGGTDLPAFHRRHGGHVLALGLDKFMYVSVNAPAVGQKVRVNYTRNEVVDRAEDLRHELARAALLHHGLDRAIEITSMADLPSATGLGSSSCYLIGLLRALGAHRRQESPAEELAAVASKIEIDDLGSPVGVQDPYMAALGGLAALDIGKDGEVTVHRISLPAAALVELAENTRLYWTGLPQTPHPVMRDHLTALERDGSAAHQKVSDGLQRIMEISQRAEQALAAQEFDLFGQLLDETWQHKKTLSAKVGIPGIDQLYAEVKQRFGVLGGKVAGAGGGGFFVLYAPRNHEDVDGFMAARGLQRMAYGVDPHGSQVVVHTTSGAGGGQPEVGAGLGELGTDA